MAKKTQKPMDAFSLSLEENATDSLNHALEHVVDGKPNSIKYMIIHSHHAVELFLKARLAKAHFTLIYEKPEAAAHPNAKTVDFKTLVGRLQTVGVKLTEEELEHLSVLKEKRNTIEHHKVNIDLEEGRLYVGRALRFLEEFVEDELKKDIEDIVTQQGFEALVQEFYSYEERVEQAKEEANRDAPDPRDGGDPHFLDCPDCMEETMLVPSPRADGEAFCYLCKHASDVFYCSRCGVPQICTSRHIQDEGPDMCSICIEDIMSKDD